MEKEYDCMEVVPDNLKSGERNTGKEGEKKDGEPDK